MGAAQEFVTKVGVGAGSLGNILPHGSSGGAIVWIGDTGAFGSNGAEVRGIACGFPAVGHRKKYRSAEGQVVVAVDGKYSPPGIRITAATDICEQKTGDSGRVDGLTAYFRRFCERDRL